MKENNNVLNQLMVFLLSIVIMSICISCGSPKKNSVAETTTTTTNETQETTKKEVPKNFMRATKSAPDKNPNLDKVKITGTLEGSINKTIESQAEISSNNKDLTISVAKNLISGLKVGDTTMVNTPSGQYQATITGIPRVPQNGIYPVQASFQTAIPKMSSRIYPCTYNYKKKRTRYVPRSVVYYEDSRPYVYIVDYDDIVRKQYIDFGIQSDVYIEILEGLLYDSFILTDWNEDIKVGEEVRYEVDTNDFIDDNYIITKTSDSLTITDGDTEITFYDDGSFGGGGNFSNEHYYEEMVEQYDYDTNSESIVDNTDNIDYNESDYTYDDNAESDNNYNDNTTQEHYDENVDYSEDNYHETENDYEENNTENVEHFEDTYISSEENYAFENDYDSGNNDSYNEVEYHEDIEDNHVEQDEEIQYTTLEEQIDDPGMNYDDSVDNDSEELE